MSQIHPRSLRKVYVGSGIAILDEMDAVVLQSLGSLIRFLRPTIHARAPGTTSRRTASPHGPEGKIRFISFHFPFTAVLAGRYSSSEATVMRLFSPPPLVFSCPDFTCF